VDAGIRNGNRIGRLHWLQGERAQTSAWDAYESADGQPLLSIATPQPWSSVARWLTDIAGELDAHEKDGTLGQLSLDRIWVASDSHAKLLDFRAPGLATTDGDTQNDAQSGSELLYRLATFALKSRTVPLPLEASEFLRRLRRDEFASLPEIVAATAALQDRPDSMNSSSRGMTLALSVVTYLVGANLLGNSIVNFVGGDHWLAQPELAGLLASTLLAVCWAAIFRGGFWLRAFGIAVVTSDGVEASRLRAVSRALVAWSWVPVQVVVTIGGGGPSLVIAVVKLIGLLYAAGHPARGIQDRLAGTYLVPR
jgi:hypothetical protein